MRAIWLCVLGAVIAIVHALRWSVSLVLPGLAVSNLVVRPVPCVRIDRIFALTAIAVAIGLVLVQLAVRATDGYAATHNPGTGLSTNYDWAKLVLQDGGWSTCPDNVTVITQWMASENPPANWWNRNNPLNNGLGSGGGSGTGSYSDLATAAYYVALQLESSSDGYPAIKAALVACASPSVTATAIQDSTWAESHYGHGSSWRTSTVETVAAPAAAWNPPTPPPTGGGVGGIAELPDVAGAAQSQSEGLKNSDSGWGWPIVALATAGVLSLGGYGALRLRSKRSR